MDSGDAQLQVELQPTATATATNLTRSPSHRRCTYLSTPQVRLGHEIVSCAKMMPNGWMGCKVSGCTNQRRPLRLDVTTVTVIFRMRQQTRAASGPIAAFSTAWEARSSLGPQ